MALRRWLIAPPLGLVAVLLILLFLRWAIRSDAEPGPGDGPDLGAVSMVQVKPEPDQRPPDPMELPKNAPPPPPDAPPSLARPELPGLSEPALTDTPMDAGPINVAVNVNTSGLALGSGSFGGFLRGGGGGGGGTGGGGGGGGTGSGGGYAKGQGFDGKTLVPLSTARPQMPEWACKQKIKGWVEVVFVVMPNGRVRDVKIVDADPKGVYEAAAIESVSNWIYASYAKAREVKQRVPMDPADCEYNWR